MKNQQQFEEKLGAQRLRTLPAEWREQILRAARSQLAEERTSSQSLDRRSVLGLLRKVLWPHPAAWGALATAWLLIAGLNFSVKDEPLGMASAVTGPGQPAELRNLLIEQDRLLAELLEGPALPAQPVDARPRSARNATTGRA